ncbi:MAG: carbohydrate ABC transporter permease [Chloroflexi bacterium]|nr:carbohydrate ABC transporter permease [Chloroflexota bacterium]MCL5275320.1 carbohydrate ABC transporter permease [Chloroflexota bacterium]
MIEKKSLGNIIFHTINYIFLGLFALFCILPFWIMLVASFTDDMALRQNGYLPWISQFSAAAYKWVFAGQEIQIGYEVTIFVTTVGTLGSLIAMSGLAYVMSLKRLKFRNAIAFYVFIPMIFTPGIVPWFIVTRNIWGLKDVIWALIFPMMIQSFWVFVLRNFFSALPQEIIESAYIDGASDATIFYSIILPLSKPVLATVGLFMAVAYWNDWFLGVMLLDFANFRPLSVLILKMVNNAQAILTAMKQPGVTIRADTLPTLSIRMATAVITIGPIILVYPFVQRYFVQGLTLGAIKG